MDIERISNQVTGTGTAGGGLFTVASSYSLSEIGVFVGIVLTIVFGALNLALKYYFEDKALKENIRHNKALLKLASRIPE